MSEAPGHSRPPAGRFDGLPAPRAGAGPLAVRQAGRVLPAIAVIFAALIARAEEQPGEAWPATDWPAASPADLGLDATKLEAARDYALSAGGSGLIVVRGRAVLRWGDQRRRHDIKSATKSFGATLLGVAVKEGLVDLDAAARRYSPALGVPPESNLHTGWLEEITLLRLATQTAGFAKPGGYEKLLFRPGTHWHYSDGGPNWLADCLTLQYGRDLEAVLFDRVLSPLGITKQDLQWRRNQYREHELNGIPRREFGAGIHANVEALSRLGYLYLRQGRWRDREILTKEFIALAASPVPAVVGAPEWPGDPHGNASDHYGLLWWNNHDGSLPHVPRDAFWAWGLYDSLILVIPSLDLVAARGGESGEQWPRDEGKDHYAALEPFFNPVVAAVMRASPRDGGRLNPPPGESPPYPPSETIRRIEWAPASSIIRRAPGSDNWPITWGDDDQLYTAYGDGRGFEPYVERKLSLGLSCVSGGPENLRGVNLRAPTAERTGDGERGEKASGILMVDGVL